MSEFVSTRDPQQVRHSFADPVVDGLGVDAFGQKSGLYVPLNYSRLSSTELAGITHQKYTAIVEKITGLLGADELPASDFQDMVESAYSLDNFPETEDGQVVPVRQIDDNLYLANLSLGPTAAFKDIPMQLMSRMMAKILGYNGDTKNLLGATSGDTGSAAEHAFKMLEQITHLFMLSPLEGMADFQRWQMGELSGDNIHNISIEGDFDACQDLVKELQKDADFPKFGAVNSINWGRIASQVPYYFAAYASTMSKLPDDQFGEEVDFVVPSGNFGNILAGHIARKMGLPIRVLVAATNENSILDTLIQTGEYRSAEQAKVTSSPSMDITKASNFERPLFEDILDHDPVLTAKYMQTFAERGHIGFKDFGIQPRKLIELGFDSGVSTHLDRIAAIKWLWMESDKTDMIDPHTAAGVAVARERLQMQHERGERQIPTIVMETALPVKFRQTVQDAIGREPFVPAKFQKIYSQTEAPANAFKLLPNNSKIVGEYILTTMAA